MDTTPSKNLLESILDFSELSALFESFCALTGIDITLFDADGDAVLARRARGENLCDLNPQNLLCREGQTLSAARASEIGEHYVFSASCGLVKCTIAVIHDGKPVGSLSLGPVALWDNEDFDDAEFLTLARDYELGGKTPEQALRSIVRVSCKTFTHAARIASASLSGLLPNHGQQHLKDTNEIYKQQRSIGELLIDKKSDGGGYKRYPAEKEKQLIAYVQSGDNKRAKGLLNELLGEIFFYTSGNPDTIKIKLYELSAFLMRAIVDAGVPLSEVSPVIKRYNNIFSENTGFEEMCFLTTEVLESFMALLYRYRSTDRQSEHLVRAMQYIRENYASPITLTSVAKHIFLSPYYMSHLFSSGLKLRFSEYVTKIRLEEGRKLLSEGRKVGEVARLTGFSDANYFAKTFKKHCGMTPKRYSEITSGRGYD